MINRSSLTKVIRLALGVACALLKPDYAMAQSTPPAASEIATNAEPGPGPPDSALSPTTEIGQPGQDRDTPHSWYVDKGDSPYLDFFGAWGWKNHTYLATVSALNMYLHDKGDWAGFHARMFALGLLSFERQRIAPGTNPSRDRRTTFVLEVFDPSLRAYFLGPVFFAFGLDIGMAFYDSVVPTLDLQGGLGFEYAGWGLESGLRSSRLPTYVTAVDGKDLVYTGYNWQLYINLETNIPY